MMARRALLILGAAVLLQACATAKPVVYGPISETAAYGYRDRQNPDGGHTVLVVLPSASPMTEVRAWFERRSKEVCPAGIERTNIFRATRNETTAPLNYGTGTASVASRIVTSSELEGYVYCKPEGAGASG